MTPRQINAQRKRDGKPPLNFALLRRIIKKLETNPESYDQTYWGRYEHEATCGTAACIAGWAANLDGKKTLEQLRRNPSSVKKIGAKSLGLWSHDYMQDEIDVLFDGTPRWSWPEPFASSFAKARTPQRQARVAIRYLNRIITTGKVL